MIRYSRYDYKSWWFIKNFAIYETALDKSLRVESYPEADAARYNSATSEQLQILIKTIWATEYFMGSFK